MRVRVVVPMYPPYSLVGSWLTTHEFMRDLVAHGHRVDVTAYQSRGGPLEHEGVVVETTFAAEITADVVVGHAGDDGSAMAIAGRLGVPLVLMAHGGDPEVMLLRLEAADLAVFNSHNLRDAVGWDGPSVVCHPPVDRSRYATTPGDRVTLVNTSADKGGVLFWSLAERLPDVPFMAVVGGYGRQILWSGHPNVVIQRHSPNVTTEVYGRTRVLLLPSIVETWGRVAIEAACSGIPTIAHPTSGALEALGDAATYVDRDDLDGWAEAIERLMRPAWWHDRSTAALARAHALDSAGSLDRFRDALDQLIGVRT